MGSPPGRTPAHLLFRVLEGDHQHHIPRLELQLVCVCGRVVMLGLHLQGMAGSCTPSLEGPGPHRRPVPDQVARSVPC